jgi:hypothetical protein
MRVLLSVAVIVIAAVAAVTALHEDEAGKYDWYLPGVGPAALAAFHPVSKSHKTVYVASEKNVIASYGLQHGELRWRHVLGTQDNITCLYATERNVFAGTSSGVVIAVDAVTGVISRTYPLVGSVVACGVVGDSSKVVTVVEAPEEYTVRVITFSALPTDLPLSAVEEWKAASASAKASGAIRKAAIVAGTNKFVAVTERSTVVVGDLSDLAKPFEPSSQTGVSTQGLFRATCADKAFYGDRATTSWINLGKTKNNKPAPENRFSFACDDSAFGEVTDKGFLAVAGSPTGLRTRPGTPVQLLAARADGKGRVEAVVASASGAFQYLRLKATEAADAPELALKWSVEGGLADIDQAVFPAARGNLAVGASVDEASTAEFRELKFGLNDRIVALSRGGMLYSLRTNDAANSTEWMAYPEGDAAIEYPSVRQHWSTAATLVEDADDRVTVRIQFDDAQTTVVQLSYDVFTGRLVSHNSAAKAKASVFLPDGSVVTGDLTVTGEALNRQRDYHTVNRSAGQIVGYTIPAASLNAEVSWTVTLGGPLVAVASGAADPRAVASVEHMRYIPNASTGIKDIRRKYPTANLLVTAHFLQDSSDDGEAKSLVITAIDTVTGQTLASMRHSDVDGKVSIIIVEHLVVYSFLSVESMRYMVGVWEMFEHQDTVPQDTQYTSPALVVMSFMEKRRRFSALTTRPPHITPHLLAFPYSDVASVGLTVTKQGIARKVAIFATTEGSVVSVPLSMLMIGGIPDAGPAASRGLLGSLFGGSSDSPAPKGPPRATIMVPPTSFLSHKHRVHRASRIVSAPTPLESTSHVLVAGLDLFYTRASSGKPFDMVDEDFSRQGLLIGCIVLPVLVIVLRFVSQWRSLKLAWA